jgi:hypothetical protein
MIIVRIKGGLGNQMFLYALGRHLSFKYNAKLFLDTSPLEMGRSKLRAYELDNFNISGKKIILPFNSTIPIRIFFKIFKILSKYLKKWQIYPRQKDYYFDKRILEKRVFFIDDYWQCEDYFKPIEKIIKKEFTLKEKPNAENKLMLDKIDNSNSICIHVRRGDVASVRGLEVGRKFDFEYHPKAIRLIKKKIKNPNFFIFSEDIPWVKKNLKIPGPKTYVDINTESYKDLNLMKNCKHFIITNSTFSWWAAWLSENNNKIIIAPKNWFTPLRKNEIPKGTKKKWPYVRDEGSIVPKNWIRV